MEVVRNYKDTIFRMMYRDKGKLLDLYNAVNGTSHTDPEALEITTLENAIYMNMKNDMSFILDLELNLYEQQSTVNPNMPLRDLFYIADLLQAYLADASLYGSVRIPIPTPKFVVFYNGTEKQPERQLYRLSEAFYKPVEAPELELVVTVININSGNNSGLMQACKSLREYVQYTERVRKYAAVLPLNEAVERAVTECINEGILADFLKKNRSEAIKVSIYEFDEEKYKRTLIEESKEKERENGIHIFIQFCKELQMTWDKTLYQIQTRYDLTSTVAADYMQRHW